MSKKLQRKLGRKIERNNQRQERMATWRKNKRRTQLLNERLRRIISYLSFIIVAGILTLMSHFNIINRYNEMKPFKEDGVEVSAKLLANENYEKKRHGKYDNYWLGGQADLTVAYELDGKEITRTYENVYLAGSEGNMDKYTHIRLYVKKDGSDIQTKITVDYILERMETVICWDFIFLGIYVVGVLLLEIFLFGNKLEHEK